MSSEPGSSEPSSSEPKSPGSADPEQLHEIPHPPEKPLLGNVLDLSADTQVQDLMALARKYGGIFSLQIAGRRLVVVSSHQLVEELCDESRFDKRIWAPLRNVREFAGDGLFTAHTFEPNWPLAHTILMPAFSTTAMRRYHPMMVDIATQMLDKWSRLNPGDEIDVGEEMTRLTLDTIGLCGFGYRFNSFYRERPHSFIRAMTRALSVAMDRSARPGLATRLSFRENQRFKRAVDFMNQTVDGIIEERRRDDDALPPQGTAAHDDLLSAMLTGVDPDSGQGLDDLNIRYQIITFLIAGHETTSGLLSFATYFLLQHPEVLRRAVAEVDEVLGDDLERAPTYEQVARLPVIRQILNESLRLWPTAPMFALFPKEGETTLGNRYAVDKRDGLAVLVPMLHRDPLAWGPNAEVFDIEHFSPEAEAARPVNAFKPFGNGQRACIGRLFAMHEATLALAMLLQRFELHDPHNYRLRIQETLTLKPRGLRIHVEPRRRGQPRVHVRAPGKTTESVAAPAAPLPLAIAPSDAHGTPLTVLYGSNMGSAEAVAERIAADGVRLGYTVTVEPLDLFARRLPTEGVVVLISASYNGAPPDNARNFVHWLEHEVEPGELESVRFAVFGCGHRDWRATYQAVPQLLDHRLELAGANRVCPRGEGNAGGDFDGDFESWYRTFWPAVHGASGVEITAMTAARAPAQLRVEILEERHLNPFAASFEAQPLVVTENRELQSHGAGRSTRHLELELPSGVHYRPGDHLGILPHNDERLVRRVAATFGFDEDTRIRIQHEGPGRAELPIGHAISLGRVLGECVELQEPATRAQIEILLEHTAHPEERQSLTRLLGPEDAAQQCYRSEVLGKRRSPLDLLEELPSCELPFELYLAMLPPLRPRYYSISSSPALTEHRASLTVGVVDGPAWRGSGRYQGVCSHYLAARPEGGVVYGFVRDGGNNFHLPDDPGIPLILVGPGTGVAPFRGFLQQRLAWHREGRALGTCLLFFGCRHPEHDDLYRGELQALEAAGVARTIRAYSRLDPVRKVYVQDKMREHGGEVLDLLEQGAILYVCGDAAQMAPAVQATLAELYQQRSGCTSEQAEQWLQELTRMERCRIDVWA